MQIQSLSEPIDSGIFGGKAGNLSELIRIKLPVPKGFAIGKKVHSDFEKDQLNEGHFLRELSDFLNAVGAIKYMVRSSAIGEDSLGNSFAGQLESFISDPDLDSVYQNIKRCWNSYHSEAVLAYQSHTGRCLGGMGVVVQELIEPEFAGVIFTRSHLQHDQLLVEYVAGHGELLVSGQITPKQFHYDPEDGQATGDWLPVFQDCISLAQRIEQHYKFPCDIEWAFKEGSFFIVQSRPITTSVKQKIIYWSNTNVNENYPGPISPLLYSIARQSYYNYFKNLSKLFSISDPDIRRLESAFTNVIGVHGAKMYYNMSSIHEILSASPFGDSLIKSFDNFVGYEEGKKAISRSAKLRDKAIFIWAFLKINKRLDSSIAEFESLIDQYFKDVDNAITRDELKRNFSTFIEIRMHSWNKASIADFYAMTFHGLLGKFCSKYYQEFGTGIQNTLIQAIPGIISSKPILELDAIIKDIRSDDEIYQVFKRRNSNEFLNIIYENEEFEFLKIRINEYLNNWGFRCSGELMLTELNYVERPDKFISLLMQYDEMSNGSPREIIEEKHREQRECVKLFRKKIVSKNWYNPIRMLIDLNLLNFLVAKAQQGIASRERARLKQALLYFGFKKTISRIESDFIQSGLLESTGDILFMTYAEIAEHLSASCIVGKDLMGELKFRKNRYDRISKQVYPDDFYSFDGDYVSPDNIIKKESLSADHARLTGLCACGGYVEGRVTVLRSVLEADKLKKGDILVTRQTDPGWVVVFPLISGLIVERGGMLSHGAIVSREFGIPAIVGVENATHLLKDGDEIILNADKGEIAIK